MFLPTQIKVTRCSQHPYAPLLPGMPLPGHRNSPSKSPPIFQRAVSARPRSVPARPRRRPDPPVVPGQGRARRIRRRASSSSRSNVHLASVDRAPPFNAWRKRRSRAVSRGRSNDRSERRSPLRLRSRHRSRSPSSEASSGLEVEAILVPSSQIDSLTEDSLTPRTDPSMSERDRGIEIEVEKTNNEAAGDKEKKAYRDIHPSLGKPCGEVGCAICGNKMMIGKNHCPRRCPSRSAARSPACSPARPARSAARPAPSPALEAKLALEAVLAPNPARRSKSLSKPASQVQKNRKKRKRGGRWVWNPGLLGPRVRSGEVRFFYGRVFPPQWPQAYYKLGLARPVFGVKMPRGSVGISFFSANRSPSPSEPSTPTEVWEPPAGHPTVGLPVGHPMREALGVDRNLPHVALPMSLALSRLYRDHSPAPLSSKLRDALRLTPEMMSASYKSDPHYAAEMQKAFDKKVAEARARKVANDAKREQQHAPHTKLQVVS